MNISNFFKFIGEKRPEYEFSAENENLMDMMKDSYEEAIQDSTYDYNSTKEFLPLPVKDQGYVDENGKQGLFMIIHAQCDVEPEYDYEYRRRSYDFTYHKIYVTYKNDQKDGLEKLYNKRDELITTTEYKNGKMNGKQILYKNNGANIRKVNHYVDDRLVSDDLFYDNGKKHSTSFYKTEVGRTINNKETMYSTPDLSKPIIYYSYETGEPIDRKTYEDQEYFKNKPKKGYY